MNRFEKLCTEVVINKMTERLNHFIDCYNLAIERKDWETARRLHGKIMKERELQTKTKSDEEEQLVATYCKRKGLPYEPPK